MEIIPAIDLRGGRCVRLVQGQYDRETVFSEDPVEMARQWELLGAPRLHVVDLDGAREGSPKHLSVIGEICAAVGIPVQAGGGIRSVLAARRALDLGVHRVIVGTAALDPKVSERFVRELGDALVAGIDARDGKVAVRGWLDTTEMSALDLAHKLVDVGIRTIVFTDIARDGMLTGPNLPALRKMVKGVKAAVIASGGIASVADVRAVKAAGAAGAIVGMALYSGELDLAEAMRAAC